MAGLKSLAQELQSKGRNGDTMLAHINPQEAGILKALGGSGTINPATGLPEFFFKAVSRAVAAPFKAVNEVVKAVPIIGPAIDRGLVGLDKAVGSTIPGGWNTLAQTALAFTPLGLPAKMGLAALGGSGAFGKEGKFNFQRALLSAAMTYGANQLTQGLTEAGQSAYDPSTGLTSATAQTPVTGSGDVFSGLAGSGGPPLEVNPELFKAAQSNIDPGLLEGMSASNVAGANVLPSVPNAPAPSFLQQTGANLSAAGQGIKNLTGFGTGAGDALDKFTAPITTRGMMSLGVGTLGTMSLDEQEKALNEQRSLGAVNDAEYNRQMALIDDGRRRAEEAMRANPYQFAMGGTVNPPDDQTGITTYSPIEKYGLGSMASYAAGGYAMGGEPRFLSGGGDGMSDSIKANINGTQPARLADGEFVIPADVVSHIGNGSSKAGAKQLYAMMDRARKARTGTTKQAKALNPAKMMPA
jgi:hypothetical protein